MSSHLSFKKEFTNKRNLQVSLKCLCATLKWYSYHLSKTEPSNITVRNIVSRLQKILEDLITFWEDRIIANVGPQGELLDLTEENQEEDEVKKLLIELLEEIAELNNSPSDVIHGQALTALAFLHQCWIPQDVKKAIELFQQILKAPNIEKNKTPRILAQFYLAFHSLQENKNHNLVLLETVANEDHIYANLLLHSENGPNAQQFLESATRAALRQDNFFVMERILKELKKSSCKTSITILRSLIKNIKYPELVNDLVHLLLNHKHSRDYTLGTIGLSRQIRLTQSADRYIFPVNLLNLSNQFGSGQGTVQDLHLAHFLRWSSLGVRQLPRQVYKENTKDLSEVEYPIPSTFDQSSALFNRISTMANLALTQNLRNTAASDSEPTTINSATQVNSTANITTGQNTPPLTACLTMMGIEFQLALGKKSGGYNLTVSNKGQPIDQIQAIQYFYTAHLFGDLQAWFHIYNSCQILLEENGNDIKILREVLDIITGKTQLAQSSSADAKTTSDAKTSTETQNIIRHLRERLLTCIRQAEKANNHHLTYRLHCLLADSAHNNLDQNLWANLPKVDTHYKAAESTVLELKRQKDSLKSDAQNETKKRTEDLLQMLQEELAQLKNRITLSLDKLNLQQLIAANSPLSGTNGGTAGLVVEYCYEVNEQEEYSASAPESTIVSTNSSSSERTGTASASRNHPDNKDSKDTKDVKDGQDKKDAKDSNGNNKSNSNGAAKPLPLPQYQQHLTQAQQEQTQSPQMQQNQQVQGQVQGQVQSPPANTSSGNNVASTQTL